MKIIKPLLLVFALCVFPPQDGRAQARQPGKTISFEFADQNIRDILYAFSTYARIPITADDTADGKASFQFNGASFEQAFDAFLLTNRLYAEKTKEPWIVSRVSIAVSEAGLVTLDARDASPAQLLEKLSQKLSVTIIQDILPSTKVSLHLESGSALRLAELIMKPFGDYSVHEGDNFIQVKKAPAQPYNANASLGSGIISIRETGGLYEASVEQARLGDVLDRLFAAAGQEYASFAWDGPYLDRQLPPDPWGNEYRYKNPGEKNLPFTIISYGADGKEGGDKQNADIYSWE